MVGYYYQVFLIFLVWSFGVTIRELITASDLFPDLTSIEGYLLYFKNFLILKIALQVSREKRTLKIPESNLLILTEILTSCFQFYPQNCATFKEIYEKLNINL